MIQKQVPNSKFCWLGLLIEIFPTDFFGLAVLVEAPVTVAVLDAMLDAALDAVLDAALDTALDVVLELFV